MAESMDDLKKELEESFEKLENGDVMSGKVENEEEAENAAAWEHMKELKNSGEDFEVKVGGMVNGGLIAYVEDIRAFIPASQISLEFVENLDEYLGKTLKVRAITVDPNRRKLVLSAKVILKEQADRELEEKRKKIRIGDIVKGKVDKLMNYGAFIDLGDGVSGLVHISAISNERIKHPGVKLKEGEEITAKVIDIKDGKISLSMKALLENDEESTEERYDIPEVGEVTTSFGDLLKNINL